MNDPVHLEEEARPATGLAGLRDAAVASFRFAVRRWRGAFVVVAVFVSAEFLLRVYAPVYANRTYSDTLTAGHPIDMNPCGYRGPELATPKPEGTLRVLALGDSVTFGTGVAANRTWPARVAASLSDSLGRPAEAMNTGLPATDLRQITLLLEDRWFASEPDIAVVMLTGNMVSLAWIRRDDPVSAPKNPWLKPRAEPTGRRVWADRASRFISSFALPGALTINAERMTYWVGLNNHRVDPAAPFGIMLAHGWRQPDLDPAVSDEAWRRTAEDLAGLAASARASGLPLLVCYAPPRFTLTTRWRDNLKRVPIDRLTIDPVERAAGICLDLGLPFIDLRGPLGDRSGEGSVYVLNDYTHFNPAGLDVIGRVIAARCETIIATE